MGGTPACSLSVCFAMDESGSIGAGDWTLQTSVVASTMQQLAANASAFAVIKFADAVENVLAPLVRLRLSQLWLRSP